MPRETTKYIKAVDAGVTSGKAKKGKTQVKVANTWKRVKYAVVKAENDYISEKRAWLGGKWEREKLWKQGITEDEWHAYVEGIHGHLSNVKRPEKNNSSLWNLWNELEEKYFDLGEDQTGIAKAHKVTLEDCLDFHNKFRRSMNFVKKEEWGTTCLRGIHKKQADRFAETILQEMRRFGQRPPSYDLRVTADRNYNENHLTQAADLGKSAFNDRFKLNKDHGAKNHLYIEALMYIEPLIDESNYRVNHGKLFKYRSVQGATYDFQQHTAFDTANKRALYFTELGTSVLKMFEGFEKVRMAQNFTKDAYGPDMEALVQWYLAHMGNVDKPGVVMYKGSQLRLEGNISKNAQSSWPGRLLLSGTTCKYSYSSSVFAEDGATDKVPQFDLHFNKVNQDPKLIAELRNFIVRKGTRDHHHVQFGKDLKQFVKDYNNIRDIWYNVEPLPQDQPRTKIENATQLAMYIQQHPFFLQTAAEQGASSDWNQGKAASWISKAICALDIGVCKAFVNLVESGMTAYDWPLFAVTQLKPFLQTPVNEEWQHCYDELFTPVERAHIARLMKMKQCDVHRVQFLPQVHETESAHQNKKRRVH